MILHGIEYQRPTSLDMRILANHVTYSFLAFMKSIFHFCLGCYCGGYSQNRRSNLSSYFCTMWNKYCEILCCMYISFFNLSLPEYVIKMLPEYFHQIERYSTFYLAEYWYLESY